MSAMFDRVERGAWGLFGGQPGRCAALLVRRAGDDRFRDFCEAFGTVSPSKLSGVVLRAGDVVRIESAGGGGFGDPHERDPELVLRDVRAGLVSRDEAERAYGVALTPDGAAVDPTGTERLRLTVHVRHPAVFDAAAAGEDELETSSTRPGLSSPIAVSTSASSWPRSLV